MPEAVLVVSLMLAAETVRDARELAIDMSVRNAGSGPVRLNTLTFPYSGAVLELRTAAGTPVAPIPPGMPPVDDEVTGRIDLAPGAQETWHYVGTSLFDGPLAPGRYAIRFRVTLLGEPHGRDWAGTLSSEWVQFTVLGA